MGYEYNKEKHSLFTDGGQIAFLKVRSKIFKMLDESGAFCLANIVDMGNSWFYLACADRMVELGEIVEVTSDECRQQDRVFIVRRML